MDKKYGVYVASPLFCDEDNRQLDIIEAKLGDLGISYFSPRKDSNVSFENIKTKEDKDNAFKKILELNEDAINSSELVLVNTKGIRHDNAIYADQGTFWETGFAFAKNIPTVTFNFEDFGVNLMIGQTVVNHYDNLNTKPEKLNVLVDILDDLEFMTIKGLRRKYYKIVEEQV